MPSEAPPQVAGSSLRAASPCPASRLPVIKRRRDFLAAARAAKQGAGSMMVQARDRADGDPAVRVGFTCSKKVGNAARRNRAKRRLREAARLVLPGAARPGWDYVLIGRAEVTEARAFAALKDDLARALRRLHTGKG